MYSLNSTNTIRDRKYYHLWINSTHKKSFFITNLDKAFFISMLQNNLSPHKKLGDTSVTKHSYSDDIDLLAYSLTETGVHLLINASKESVVDKFAHDLLVGYLKYFLNEHKKQDSPFNSIFIYEQLKDAHDALHASKDIHLMHQDWRHDRYSSIGFYLDDRRGDWIKLHHLSGLYDFSAKRYLDFLQKEDILSEPQVVVV